MPGRSAGWRSGDCDWPPGRETAGKRLHHGGNSKNRFLRNPPSLPSKNISLLHLPPEKQVVVVGGGQIAKRRVEALLILG